MIDFSPEAVAEAQRAIAGSEYGDYLLKEYPSATHMHVWYANHLREWRLVVDEVERDLVRAYWVRAQ